MPDRRARLAVVAGPIGNLSDLSPRAAQELKQADCWFVEDSRISARLQAHLQCKIPMRILNEHTTAERVSAYASEIGAGLAAALLTDAGSPGVSDPGALLVDACLDAGLEVDPIPGPSAVTCALMASGFFAQRFAFLGFLPRKAGAMKSELDPYADSPMTLVLFESPFRVDALAGALFEALGSRRVAFCRELTKMHQQICRVTLPEVPDEKVMPRKGEFTIVVEGRRKNRVK